MTSADGYSEETLEGTTDRLLLSLGWRTANCYYETFGPLGTLRRETAAEVVLVQRLTVAIQKLNSGLPKEAVNLAVEELVRDRSRMSLVAANREITKLLKDGVKVTFKGIDGEEVTETVRLVDWNNPANNDFLLATQFWITGEMYRRRLDMVGFVNGIPLVVIELKASHKALRKAYDDNLRDYKSTIPQLFWYNGIIILSNGSESKIGSMTAGWEHFAQWKKINSEGEKGVVSLETMIRGTCNPARLLDILENFTLFSEEKTDEEKTGLIKLIAKNHQYLGVNNSINALREIKSRKGRLGVFWHTQGSGKSFSMIFFAQKVLRKIPGNWTFLVVTDRDELDGQIYENFKKVGAVTEARAQAESGRDLKRMLQEDHRYVFTLIQKFRTEKGQRFPRLSERSDIVVITDEAHRTQYDTFAMNMRTAIPNAAFIAFTGTPLIAGEEKTREVFGDYVSIYNFQQSVEDGITVPLYYENRIPEVQLSERSLRKGLMDLLEKAELDEKQERKLEREFAREYHVITRDDRLEKVAKDIVLHFTSRGYQGKAMVVSIDKATAVKMYDKVEKHWKTHIVELRNEMKTADLETRDELKKTIERMQKTDMAVVVSQSQNEIEDLRKRGVDIMPHRRRMNKGRTDEKEKLDDKFKDPKDPLQIVFVCAMWMTGFDVHSCSTIYLDKPMRNHTLMQTIARANRVFKEKKNGLIIDYMGVLHRLKRALAIYAPSTGGEIPIKNKQELVRLLDKAVDDVKSFCYPLGIDLEKLTSAEGFDKIKLLDDAVEAILINDDTRNRYITHARLVMQLFRAIKPDPVLNNYAPLHTSLKVMVAKIHSLDPEVNISEIQADIEELLDRSVFARDYVKETSQPLDLSKIDFDALGKEFRLRRKRMLMEKLRAALVDQIKMMVTLNRTKMRSDLLEKYQKTVDDYNAGSLNVEEAFQELLELTRQLREEEKRGIRENLSEEELAIFDILTTPRIKLTQTEEQQVKKVSKEMLETLKKERLVLDWRKKQQTRAAVRLQIEQMLDQLPALFTPRLYQEKCDATYQHIYECYFGEGKSIYEHTGIGDLSRLAGG
jgi:type I restriction enzyme R subunit